LVGLSDTSSSIITSYSTGNVTGTGVGNVGGLVGTNNGTVTNSLWDTETSGLLASAGGVGLTTDQMLNSDNYSSWDFINTWNTPTSIAYPTLQHFFTPPIALTISVDDASKTYDMNAYNGGYVVSYSGFTDSDSAASLGDSLIYAGTAQTATDVGTYAITASGYTSDKYTFSYTPGTLTIAKAGLNITGLSVDNKTYDGTKVATFSGATITALGDDIVELGGVVSASFDNKNVGDNKAVVVTGYLLTGTDAGNYNLLQPTGLSANIETASEPKPKPKSKAIARVLASLKLPTFSVKPLVRMVAPVVRPIARPVAAPVASAAAGGAKPEAKVESGGAATASASTDGRASPSPSTGTGTATVAVKSEAKAQPVVTASVSLGNSGSVSFVMDGGVNMPETMVADNDG
jgi:hypothetical protein